MNTKANQEHHQTEDNLTEKETSSQRKIYLRREKTFVEVSDEVYKAYYQPIWQILKEAQRNGKCNCPKSKRWMCDGECYDCPYRRTPDTVSDATPIGDSEDLSVADLVLTTDLNPEKTLLFKELLSTLEQAVSELMPTEQEILRYYLGGKTDREIASLMGRSLSTINVQKKRVLAKLQMIVRDYME